MSQIQFTQDGETWWFDPETGEYEYDGPTALIKVILDHMDKYGDMKTTNVQGYDEHPGEVWRRLSPEERKDKVLNYITQVDGVSLNERRQTQNH